MLAARLAATWAAVLLAAGAPASATAAAPPGDRFAAEFYAALRNQPGNLFVSPASLADAFRLARPGAAGRTADQIRRVFHFGAEDDAPRFPVGGDGSAGELHSANALWLANNLEVRAPYLDAVRALGGAEVQRADFAGGRSSVAAHINGWAATATHQRIRDLVSPDIIRTDTRAVIANAVYFKARWAAPFAPTATRLEDFYPEGGRRMSVSMMHGSAERGYFKGRSFQVVEMPFQGAAFSMIAILPDARDGLPALEAAATPDAIAAWLRRLAPRDVDVSLPRFQMTRQVDAKAALMALGLSLPFSSHADFSRLSPEALYIDAVAHKAFVKVDEAGAEAAAATAMEVTITGQRIVNPPPVVFRADHPFLFLIRDNGSGAILFIGRLSDPQ